MNDMKYVLNSRTKKFVIFPKTMKHNEIPGEWTNAGFVSFCAETNKYGEEIIKANCYGESVSLELYRGTEDSEIIQYSMAL